MHTSLRWLHLGVFLLIGATLIGCIGCGSSTPSAKTLNGAGSTFIQPLMQEWSQLYNKEKNVQVNYQALGSGAGIGRMTDKEMDFGCSDAPLNEEQLAKAKEKGGDVVHLPLCMGGIVPAYNVPGDPELIFSGQVLMDIYLGKITEWNHENIKKLNPKVADKLPQLKISVAFRSDGSGSTYILTDYFTKVNKDAWVPGKGTSIKFPVGTGSKGTDGVAGFVKQTSGAIGYVELVYALKNNIKYAAVINQAGEPIKADPKSVTAAAATAEIPDDLRYSITNAPGKNAYPIAGTTWAIAYVKQPADKVQTLTEFLTWITHQGQEQCEKLYYARLPENLVKKVEQKIKMIEAAK